MGIRITPKSKLGLGMSYRGVKEAKCPTETLCPSSMTFDHITLCFCWGHMHSAEHE